MEKLVSQLDERTFILIVMATILCIVTALITYVLWPGYESYRQSDDTLEVLTRIANAGEGLEQEIAELQANVDSLNHTLHGDMGNLSDSQLEAVVIGRMQSISWRNHIELTSIKPVPAREAHLYREVSFEVEIAGGYFDIFAWVEDITRELGFVVIKRFEIQPLQRKGDAPRLRGSLTLASYQEADDA